MTFFILWCLAGTAVGIVFGNIANYVQGTGLMVIVLAAFVAPIVWALVFPKKKAA